MPGEIASAFLSIVPSLRGAGREIDRQLGPELDQSSDNAGRRFGRRFSESAGAPVKAGFGKLSGIAAGAFAAAGIGSIFTDSINQASDLNEATTKLQAIFGKAGEAQVQAFAKNGPRALGQNKLAVLDAAAEFGTFGKAAGLTGTELAKFSTGFASLSTDLASFNNTSPEEAVNAIGAALRGESEPLRSYGVLLDDTSLRQEALRLGLIKTTKSALTPQQKVLAAQAVIYKQTKDAQGDFARTSGGLANQQRILSASITDLKGRFGQLLLPILVRTTNGINNGLLPAVDKITGAAKQVFGVLFKGDFKGGPFAEDGVFVDTLFKIREQFERFKPTLTTVFDFLKSNAKPILIGLAAAFAAVTFPVTSTIVALGVLYARSQTFRDIIATVVDYVRANVIPAFQQFGQFLINTVFPALVKVGQFLVSTFKPTFVALKDVLVGSILPAFQGLAARFRENLPQIQAFAKVAGAVVVVAAALGAKIAGFLAPILIKLAGTYFKGVIAVIGVGIGVFGRIITIISTTISIFVRIGTTIAGFVRAAASAFNSFKGAVSTALGGVVTFVSALPGRILSAISSLPGALLRAGTTAIQGLGKGIGNGAKGVFQFFTGLPGRVKGAIGDAGQVLYDTGVQIVAGLIRGIKNKAKDIGGAITAPLKAGVGIAKKALGIFSPSRVFAALGEQTMQGYVVGVGSKTKSVTDAVTNNMKVAIEAAKKSGKKLLDVLTDQLNASEDRLGALRDAGKDLRSSVTSSVGGSLSDLFKANSITDILSASLQQSIDAQSFTAAINRLKARKGVSNNLINQLLQAGPTEAGKFTGLLANSTDAQLRGFLGSQSDTAKIASAAGRGAEQRSYAAVINKVAQTVVIQQKQVNEQTRTNSKLDLIADRLDKLPKKVGEAVGAKVNGAAR